MPSGLDKDPPCTPPRPTGNAGTGRSESDSEMDSPQASDDDLPGDTRKRKWNGRKEFTLIKRWVTGEKADMDSEDIERELFELARDWIMMSLSKL